MGVDPREPTAVASFGFGLEEESTAGDGVFDRGPGSA
jgi:hypothetical protein